jgi:hypothetical protein
MKIPRKRKPPDPAVEAAADELAQSQDSLAGAKAQLEHAERHVVAALQELRAKNNVTGLAAGLIRKGKETGDPGAAPG